MRIILTIFALLVAAGCGKDNKKEQDDPTSNTPDNVTPPGGADDGNDVVKSPKKNDAGNDMAKSPDNGLSAPDKKGQDSIVPKGKSDHKKSLRKSHDPSKPAENEVEIGTGDKKKIVTVRGSFFAGGKKVGDFNWMIDRPEYAKTLFVFNDNEGQFVAFQNNDRGSNGCGVGGGNGVIRPKQCVNPPRAAGVPTGSAGGGYKTLDTRVKGLIKQSIAHIRKVLEEGDYDTVLFSQARNTRMIGAAIFNPSDEIKEYIFKSLLNLNAE